ncbi:hypothetical protein F441_07765 [Phytophthora nicotianae CJ01A1]|uniref:Phosphoribosyltransferase domain-containing protein n=2 Tax=Phytophthora nicotianae TaxID=4792 RepID=W2J4V8_PHYNI|nr:hypothetical protein L915_07621 [Phytophthora nicotianae]ETL41485.1 hypothetical protein L916_07553 [Phytophthora nicotianae]ETP17994.1 hypothetical protein F441_07765 [Phytophthora nicotianae CJ01A1]
MDSSSNGAITSPSPAMSAPCKRKQAPLEVSMDKEDEGVRIALLSWLNKRHTGSQDDRASPLTPSEALFCSTSQDNGAPNVRITVQFSAPPQKRTSRYLCEGDRREIIKRVDDGEQQAALATEFNVSRAAVCNLYKNRWDVLNREVADPKAKHPKKPRYRKSIPLLTSSTNTAAFVVERMTNSSAISPMLANPPVSLSNASVHSSVQSEISPSGEDKIRAVATGQDHRRDQQDQLQDQRSQSKQCGTLSNLAESRPFFVHEASAHSRPCRNLVAALRDKDISSILFQQRATRLARLLIEEALTCLPHDSKNVTNHYGDICCVTKTLDERDICGVSMEGRGSVLLRAFSDINPASLAGIVSIDKRDDGSLSSVKAHLPTIRMNQVVFLFDIQCITGAAACTVLHYLTQDEEIAADQIYFVTLISSFEGLKQVFKNFPGAALVTAQVDVLDKNQCIRPGIGDFNQCLWNVEGRIIL